LSTDFVRNSDERYLRLPSAALSKMWIHDVSRNRPAPEGAVADARTRVGQLIADLEVG
jgi:hypothetical protein